MESRGSMAKSLVIVESPAKARTINKYLGSGFRVVASMGHIRDLPKNKLGVDVEAGFTPEYVAIPARKKVIKELRDAARGVSDVYVATDPDREGEAIGWHLARELGAGKRRVSRLMFNEITRDAVRAALDHPVEIDQRMVDAQQARRVLDRLVGYKLSPLLWDKVRRGLSAGRVQSVALKLVCDREGEIERFVSEEYWHIKARLAGDAPPEFGARLVKKGNSAVKIGSESESQAVLAELDGAAYVVESVVTKERRRHAAPPFITSKLQQVSRFPVKRTMQIAQQLYEGIELPGEGSVGLITYMRTDSTRVAEQALGEVRAHIGEAFGAEYLPAKPNRHRTKKDAQDAHEAIRPTSVSRTPEQVRPHLSREQHYLYRLIWNRFVASQMPPATFDDTTVEIGAAGYRFRAKGSVPKFNGWMAVYSGADLEAVTAPVATAETEDEPASGLLPPLVEGARLTLKALTPEQKFTQPPPRFSEASLVKELEENGIGRPQHLRFDHRRAAAARVRREDGGPLHADPARPAGHRSAVRQLRRDPPGGLHAGDGGAPRSHRGGGRRLPGHDQRVLRDVQHRSREGGRVDARRQGERAAERRDVRQVRQADGRQDRQVRDVPGLLRLSRLPQHARAREDGRVERRDGGDLRELRPARWWSSAAGSASFLACTGYPECKTTRKLISTSQGLAKAKPDRPLDESCPQCGKQLVVKQGRFGEFTSCSSYPACRYLKHESTGVACPRDGGDIVVRKSRRGRVFYGCANYPDCDFTVWNKPLPEACPACDAPFLLEKVTKRHGRQVLCHNDACDYVRSEELAAV